MMVSLSCSGRIALLPRQAWYRKQTAEERNDCRLLHGADLRALEGKCRRSGPAPLQKLTTHQRQIMERLKAAHGDDLEVRRCIQLCCCEDAGRNSCSCSAGKHLTNSWYCLRPVHVITQAPPATWLCVCLISLGRVTLKKRCMLLKMRLSTSIWHPTRDHFGW